jgi:hypothetical protein
MASERVSAPAISGPTLITTSPERRRATETPAVVSAAPSVAATIAPDAVAPSRSSEPIARFVPAKASVDAPKAVGRDVMEVVLHEPPVEVSARAPSTDIAAVSETTAATAGVPMTQAGAYLRTMEDIADLCGRCCARGRENMPLWSAHCTAPLTAAAISRSSR